VKLQEPLRKLQERLPKLPLSFRTLAGPSLLKAIPFRRTAGPLR
jgi:hypothetical protein